MAIVSTFIETLKRLVQDPSVGTKNAVFTDSTMVTLFTSRITALTPDQVSWLGAGDVSATAGSLTTDVTSNSISLDTDGFEMTFSKFRDGLAAAPLKIRRRIPSDVITTTPDDRVQYVMSDSTNGVLLLDPNLEVVRTFPGLTSTLPLVGATYADARCAVTATITATEYMFIACGTQHCVKVLDYATGALVATIGVAGTSGIPTTVPVRLDTPVALAVDETGMRLFIVCQAGDPVGSDSTDAGYVCEFNITAPAAPVLESVFLLGKGLYRLNHMECKAPCDVFFEPAKGALIPPQDARLWVANGLGDVAAFTRADEADPWVPTLVIPAQGRDYVLGPDLVSTATMAQNAIDVLTDSDDVTHLYVAANLMGRVEVFRASRSQGGLPFGLHETSYGKRGIESTMPFGVPLRVHSTPAEPPLTFGVFTTPSGVVADEQTPLEEDTAVPVLVVADATAGRLQRLRLPIYGTTNVVTFNSAVSEVPLYPMGWFLPADATFPPEFLTVEVRDPGDATVSPVIAAGPWREVPRAGYSVPTQGVTLTRYQFRLKVTVPQTASISSFRTGALGVLLRQAW